MAVSAAAHHKQGPSDERPIDVVCVGETMVMLSPSDSRPLAEQTSLTLGVGGAESNVACGLAALGHRAAWLGRVGSDPFGQRVVSDLASWGVDVSAVEVDTDKETGVYFKDPRPDRTGAHYYRRDSAATTMGPRLAHHPLVSRGQIVHVSGITAALSDSCTKLVEEIVVHRAAASSMVSFDVNYRPGLWDGSRGSSARTLLKLARAADIVFVGRDEAEMLWGLGNVEEIRDLLAPAPLIVIKDAAHGAVSYTADGEETFVSSPRIEVVERVGAGDAFAAGYLAALLEDRDVAARLRLGHLVAAATLQTSEDVPAVIARHELERHLIVDEAAWSTLSLP